jgi:hypothetical protein
MSLLPLVTGLLGLSFPLNAITRRSPKGSLKKRYVNPDERYRDRERYCSGVGIRI